MNEFDPNIDLIDRYLRGELQGAELETFMTKLQSDPDFKLQVEQHEKMAAAVYAFGHAQMKRYLQEKTRHRGIFNLSRKTWYFAAASVMLVAFSAAIILWKLNPGIQPEHNNTVRTEKAADSAEKQASEFVTTDSGVKKVNADTGKETEMLVQNSEDVMPPMETDDAGSTAEVADPEPIIIASNVQAVAITLFNQAEAQKSLKTEASEMKRSRTAEADAQPQPAVTAQTAKAKQSGRAESAGNDYKQPEQTRSKKTAMRFSLTFCQTPRNTPMVEIEKYNDMYFVRCYDIVYGNPLVYEWQNRYFLHSGIKVYELLNLPVQNGQKTAGAPAQEVTDQSILKLIGR